MMNKIIISTQRSPHWAKEARWREATVKKVVDRLNILKTEIFS